MLNIVPYNLFVPVNVKEGTTINICWGRGEGRGKQLAKMKLLFVRCAYYSHSLLI